MWWCTLTPTVDDMSSLFSVKHTSDVLTDVGAAGSGSVASVDEKVTVFCVCHLYRIGVLCAYAANQNLSSQVKNIRRLVNSNMRDLHTFANDTPMVRQLF